MNFNVFNQGGDGLCLEVLMIQKFSFPQRIALPCPLLKMLFCAKLSLAIEAWEVMGNG